MTELLPSLQSAFAKFMQTAQFENIPQGLQVDEETKSQRGRRPIGDVAMTPPQRDKKRRAADAARRKRNIAILDMETDPFDNTRPDAQILPFLAVLYSDQFETVVIWEDDYGSLVDRIVDALGALQEPFTIYAHNGGKFDFMFFIHKLRGAISFKGRGIMSARIGKHDLRDSFHIIPERLANIQKESFDYNNMERERRGGYRDDIIRYCISDCKYLFEVVRAFIDEFGIKLSIGQAALCELRKHYQIKRFSDGWDDYIRRYYYGGRVECLRGRGDFVGDYKLYDINSSYPNVMANFKHPVGDFQDYTLRRGVPTDDTCFIDLRCSNPHGAFVARDGSGATVSTLKAGRFYVSVHEFEIACKYNLISDVQINYCVDCSQRTDFHLFVNPLYDRRQTIKAELNEMKERGGEATQAWFDLRRQDMFMKFLLNNSYGKFGQNPRLYKDHYITEPGEVPDDEWMRSIANLPENERGIFSAPAFEGERYSVWQKPAPRFYFNNVGVAASVTGAARAVLLEALQHADGAIYCDTDSIVCKSLSGVHLHPTELGAWDVEDEFSRVIIAGKKLYSTWHKSPKKRSPEQLNFGLSPDYTVKSKGAAGLRWHDMENMLNGEIVRVVNRAPTLTKDGDQRYITRSIRATAAELT